MYYYLVFILCILSGIYIIRLCILELRGEKVDKCYILKYFDFKKDHVNISDLCRSCGISRQAFYNIINNKSVCSVYLAVRITNYLNGCLVVQGYPENVYSVDQLFKIDK